MCASKTKKSPKPKQLHPIKLTWVLAPLRHRHQASTPTSTGGVKETSVKMQTGLMTSNRNNNNFIQ
jgi:hypothetical protein